MDELWLTEIYPKRNEDGSIEECLIVRQRSNKEKVHVTLEPMILKNPQINPHGDWKETCHKWIDDEGGFEKEFKYATPELRDASYNICLQAEQIDKEKKNRNVKKLRNVSIGFKK